MNIPIYRAKKIDSDEYVEGYYCNVCQLDFIITDDALKTFDADNNRVLFGSCESEIVQIDPSTLAIHFEDMLDSQGNKIFASLNKDGKGGDIMQDDEYCGIAKYVDSRFVVEYENVEECLCEGNFEVVGIQE